MWIFLLFFASLSFAGPFSTGEPVFKWNKSNITVCWLNKERIPYEKFNQFQIKRLSTIEDSLITPQTSLKSFIQKTITEEFTKEKTGITFTGWKDCYNSGPVDTILLIGNDGSVNSTTGTSNIGRGISFGSTEVIPEGKYAYVYLNVFYKPGKIKITADNYYKLLAIHEFGHLAGLRHEHIRPEAQKDYLCRDMELVEVPTRHTSFFSTYDPSSIMNYCFNNFVQGKGGVVFYSYPSARPDLREKYKNLNLFEEKEVSQFRDRSLFQVTTSSELTQYKLRIGLSFKDIHGLKCLYKYSASEFLQKCQKLYGPLF